MLEISIVNNWFMVALVSLSCNRIGLEFHLKNKSVCTFQKVSCVRFSFLFCESESNFTALWIALVVHHFVLKASSKHWPCLVI